MKINCTLLYYSRSKDIDLIIDFGDGTIKNYTNLEDYNIKTLNYFGPLIPSYLTKQHPFVTTGKYLLKNTEFHFDSYINGFELYSLQTCDSCISISIVSFEDKCALEQNCSTNNSMSIKLESDEWLFDLDDGNNVLRLKNWELVNKGSMVLIQLNSNARIAYDISGLAKISDYSISPNFISKLNPILNYQIYFNVFLAKKYSQVEFYFSHEYLNYGLYNVTLRSEFSELTTEILIPKSKYKKMNKNYSILFLLEHFLDAICINSGDTLDKKVNCRVTASTLNRKEEFFIIYPNGSISQHNFNQAKHIFYFGHQVPQNELSEDDLLTASGAFVLPSTEFQFDSFIIGFEAYAIENGTIEIFVIIYFYLFKFFRSVFFSY